MGTSNQIKTIIMTASILDKLSSSAIGPNSNHSASSTSSNKYGSFVSITVRKDDPQNKNRKAGIKLQQDSKGRVKVKNVASNGLFGDTDLEVGDIILSVNRRRLSDGEGPDELMKWVHKYNTITVSVRKPSPTSESSSLETSSVPSTSGKKKKKKKKTNNETAAKKEKRNEK